MSDWRLPSRAAVEIIHAEQLAEHGGAVGLRDEGALISALQRPDNLAAYGAGDVFDLAAVLAHGIVKNHPFVDGNKRTGFLAAFLLLGLNGWRLKATNADAIVATLGLAAGEIDEVGYAAWLRDHSGAEEG